MNEIELKALELRRAAFEVIEKQGEPRVLLAQLYQLQRTSPVFFEKVAEQLEADNGRWSPEARFPLIEVVRDQTSRIESISFLPYIALEKNQTAAANLPEKTSPDGPVEENAEGRTSLVWKPDQGDIDWLDDFSKNWKGQKT